MTIRCPFCDYPNFPDAKKCRRCGEDLPDLCPSCGAVIKTDTTFCTVCGEIFEAPPAEDDLSFEFEESNRKKLLKSKVSSPTEFVGPRPRDMKTCPKCNRNVGDHVTFCTYCGFKFDQAKYKEDLASQSHQESKYKPMEKKEAEQPKKPAPGKPVPPGKQPPRPQAAKPGPQKPGVRPPQKTPLKVPPKAAPPKPPEQPAQKPAAGPAPKPQAPKPQPQKTVQPSQPQATQTAPPKPEQAPQAKPAPAQKIVPPPRRPGPAPLPKPTPEMSIRKRRALRQMAQGGKYDDIDQEWEQEDNEQIKKLRATRIAIKDVQRFDVKIRPPIEIPVYMERDYGLVLPEYPDDGVDESSLEIPDSMVLIPGGQFLYGLEKEERFLPSFFMDQHPVTCREYAEFCGQTNHPKPWDWANDTFLRGREDHPVAFVTRNDARAYAKWAGKRLATELEWEKAAGGTDGRLYPWGDRFDPAKCLVRNNSKRPVLTCPVDKHPEGAGPYGCLEMVGNVSEWVEAVVDSEVQDKIIIVRGGSLLDKPAMATCRTRIQLVDPDTLAAYIGFRCAKDIEPSQ